MPRPVDLQGLLVLIDRGATLVEVLPREQYEQWHLPRALSIPLSDLDERAGESLPDDRPIVVYCYDAL